MSRAKRSKILEIDILVAQFMNDFSAGYHRSLLKGWGGDFDSVRLWQGGDRRISMASTAKTGVIMAKVFDEPKFLKLWLIVDISYSMRFGSKISRQEAAAVLLRLFSLSALKAGDVYGAVMFDDKLVKFIDLNQNYDTSRELTDFILSYCSQPRLTNLNPPLAEVFSREPSQALIIIISDFNFELDGRILTLMKQLKSGENVSLLSLILYDEAENKLQPQKFISNIRDAETSKTLVQDLKLKKIDRLVIDEFIRWKTDLVFKLRQANSEFIFLNISGNYLRDLGKFFAKKRLYAV